MSGASSWRATPSEAAANDLRLVAQKAKVEEAVERNGKKGAEKEIRDVAEQEKEAKKAAEMKEKERGEVAQMEQELRDAKEKANEQIHGERETGGVGISTYERDRQNRRNKETLHRVLRGVLFSHWGVPTSQLRDLDSARKGRGKNWRR